MRPFASTLGGAEARGEEEEGERVGEMEVELELEVVFAQEGTALDNRQGNYIRVGESIDTSVDASGSVQYPPIRSCDGRFFAIIALGVILIVGGVVIAVILTQRSDAALYKIQKGVCIIQPTIECSRYTTRDSHGLNLVGYRPFYSKSEFRNTFGDSGTQDTLTCPISFAQLAVPEAATGIMSFSRMGNADCDKTGVTHTADDEKILLDQCSQCIAALKDTFHVSGSVIPSPISTGVGHTTGFTVVNCVYNPQISTFQLMGPCQPMPIIWN